MPKSQMGLSAAQTLMFTNLLEAINDPTHKHHKVCLGVLAEAVYQYDHWDCDATTALEESGFFGDMETLREPPNMRLV